MSGSSAKAGRSTRRASCRRRVGRHSSRSSLRTVHSFFTSPLLTRFVHQECIRSLRKRASIGSQLDDQPTGQKFRVGEGGEGAVSAVGASKWGFDRIWYGAKESQILTDFRLREPSIGHEGLSVTVPRADRDESVSISTFSAANHSGFCPPLCYTWSNGK